MFQGFSKETIDFMWGIRFNNEKSWFEQHKVEYQNHLYEPMKALCQDTFRQFSAAHEELGFISKVSRIYRDARRLHGNGPYKDHLWFCVREPSESWTEKPTFWFELTPDEWSFGLGYYCATALTMAKLRARVDRDPKPMEKLARGLNKQTTFTLTGADFKRPKGDPGPLLRPYYNKKNGFSYDCTLPHDDRLFSPGLPAFLTGEWEKLLPLYRYLSTLDGDPDPRES